MWEELSHYQPPSSGWKEDIEHQHIYNKDNKRQLTLEEKDELVCSHCGKTRHTEETCWELVGHLQTSQNQQKEL